MLAMSTPQRQYLYAFSEGNYREMMTSLLQNRRWIWDYTPKEDYFAFIEKSGTEEIKKLWEYVQSFGLFLEYGMTQLPQNEHL